MDRESINKIGIVAGSFDLIHPGYVRLFKDAKIYCDFLIIALQEDPTIDRPHKCRPVQTLDERKEILSSIKYVDKIIVYKTEQDLYDLLKNLDYDYRVLSEEYSDTFFTGKDLGKEVLWIKRDHYYSTTSLKQKIYEEMTRYYETNKNLENK
jgi:glycerol-3-phosphate cytidylyltransferase